MRLWGLREEQTFPRSPVVSFSSYSRMPRHDIVPIPRHRRQGSSDLFATPRTKMQISLNPPVISDAACLDKHARYAPVTSF